MHNASTRQLEGVTVAGGGRRMGQLPTAELVAVPDRARRLAAHDEYEVAFRIVIPTAVAPRSSEQWIRATFEGAPRRWRWFLLAGWAAITCRLRPRRSAGRVLGWRVEGASSPDVAVIVVRAWIGLTSRIVTLIDGNAVTLCSFVEFSGPTAPVARAVWAMTVPLHERVLPHLLSRAVRRAGPVR